MIYVLIIGFIGWGFVGGCLVLSNFLVSKRIAREKEPTWKKTAEGLQEIINTNKK